MRFPSCLSEGAESAEGIGAEGNPAPFGTAGVAADVSTIMTNSRQSASQETLLPIDGWHVPTERQAERYSAQGAGGWDIPATPVPKEEHAAQVQPSASLHLSRVQVAEMAHEAAHMPPSSALLFATVPSLSLYCPDTTTGEALAPHLPPADRTPAAASDVQLHAEASRFQAQTQAPAGLTPRYMHEGGIGSLEPSASIDEGETEGGSAGANEPEATSFASHPDEPRASHASAGSCVASAGSQGSFHVGHLEGRGRHGEHSSQARAASWVTEQGARSCAQCGTGYVAFGLPAVTGSGSGTGRRRGGSADDGSCGESEVEAEARQGWHKLFCVTCLRGELNTRRLLPLANRCYECPRRAGWGDVAGVRSSAARCKEHRLATDVYVLRPRCEFVQGCSRRPCFGLAGGVPQYCKYHKMPAHSFVTTAAPAGSHAAQVSQQLTCQHVARCDRRPSHGEPADTVAHFCVWHKQPHHVDLAGRRKREAREGRYLKLAHQDLFLMPPPDSQENPPGASSAATAKMSDLASVDLPGSSLSTCDDAGVTSGAGGERGGWVGRGAWRQRASARRSLAVADAGPKQLWDDSSFDEGGGGSSVSSSKRRRTSATHAAGRACAEGDVVPV